MMQLLQETKSANDTIHTFHQRKLFAEFSEWELKLKSKFESRIKKQKESTFKYSYSKIDKLKKVFHCHLEWKKFEKFFKQDEKDYIIIYYQLYANNLKIDDFVIGCLKEKENEEIDKCEYKEEIKEDEREEIDKNECEEEIKVDDAIYCAPMILSGEMLSLFIKTDCAVIPHISSIFETNSIASRVENFEKKARMEKEKHIDSLFETDCKKDPTYLSYFYSELKYTKVHDKEIEFFCYETPHITKCDKGTSKITLYQDKKIVLIENYNALKQKLELRLDNQNPKNNSIIFIDKNRLVGASGFIGYKLLFDQKSESYCIAKLGILIESGISYSSPHEKMRCNKLYVFRIKKIIISNDKIEYGDQVDEATNCVHDDKFICYRSRNWMIEEEYDSNLKSPCAKGIHFYLNQENIFAYHPECQSNQPFFINKKDYNSMQSDYFV